MDVILAFIGVLSVLDFFFIGAIYNEYQSKMIEVDGRYKFLSNKIAEVNTIGVEYAGKNFKTLEHHVHEEINPLLQMLVKDYVKTHEIEIDELIVNSKNEIIGVYDK